MGVSSSFHAHFTLISSSFHAPWKLSHSFSRPVPGPGTGAVRRGGLLPAPDFPGLKPPGDVVMLGDQAGRFNNLTWQGDLIAVAQ